MGGGGGGGVDLAIFETVKLIMRGDIVEWLETLCYDAKSGPLLFPLSPNAQRLLGYVGNLYLFMILAEGRFHSCMRLGTNKSK